MGSNTSATRTTRQVLDAVRRIVQALRESSRLAERQVDLSGAQLFVLHKLDESPVASVNDLADRTHTHQSTVSVVVSRLVERGLIRRVRSATDGRSVELSLTARGRRVVGAGPDVVQDRLIRAIESLPSRRRQLLASTLGELANAMTDVDQAPAMFFEERGRRRRRGRAA
jgi:DNA-binding MarR family transcriptional regulator